MNTAPQVRNRHQRTIVSEEASHTINHGSCYLTCYGIGQTKLQPGDRLHLIGEPPGHTNLLLFRGGNGMGAKSSAGEYLWPGDWVFTLEQARLIAGLMSACSGLPVKEVQTPSPVFKEMTNAYFEFLATS